MVLAFGGVFSLAFASGGDEGGTGQVEDAGG